MGRYAQARRRGKQAALVSPLPAPPAPSLQMDEDHLIAFSSSDSNEGGSIRVLQGNSPLFENATFYAEQPWAADVDFGAVDPGWYWAIETGNGTAYSGESPASEVLHYDPE